MSNDSVNHPSHYTSHPSGVECIEVTRHMTFNLGNAMKYLWRNGLKDKQQQVQDLKKAIWYIEDEIKRLGNLNLDGWFKYDPDNPMQPSEDAVVDVKCSSGEILLNRPKHCINWSGGGITHYRIVK